jgi:uncharacterized protein (DUF1697 family)
MNQHYIALLRGINVGGHRVQMADLRARFSELGFTNVETFIASGNVIFETAVSDPAELQAQIERHLHQSLGYAVPTFLRSPRELATVAAARPFADSLLDTGAATLSIMFTDVVLAPDLHDQLRPFETAKDAFHVAGREIFWLCRGKTTESLVDWSGLGNVVPLPPMTVRNATTVRKLAAKYPPRG